MATPTPAKEDTPADRRRRRLLPGVAVLTALVQTLGTAVAAGWQSTSLDLLGYALLAAGGLALVVRRRFPAATVVTVTGLTLAYQARVYPTGPTLLALLIAVVVAMSANHRGAVWATALVSYAGWLILDHPGGGRAVALAAVVVGALVILEVPIGVVRMARQTTQEQRRVQQERQRRKASEERLRIAQELHDVLGHHLSLINLRAGVGRHLMDRQADDPAALDTIRQTLDTIKQTSAEALREVRSVLDTLYPAGEAAPRAPAPRLEHLDELTDDAGLPVHTTITGEPRALPAEIDRAAYRIVQEALTNVRRHAGADASVRVRIGYDREDLVTVQVEDDGGAAAPVTAQTVEGNGISGMRERATTVGGSLVAGPLPGGGWRVRAELPLPAPDADGTR